MRLSRKLTVGLIVVILFSCSLSCALMEGAAVERGKEDLSRMTYKELLQLQSDIDDTYDVYHSPSDAQKDRVLAVVQDETQKYYSGKRIVISGWAWYSSEYKYTKNWDFYTLKTHLDYKDSNKKSKQAKIYAEVYNKSGTYNVAYLTTDGTVIIDTRAEYGNTLWFTEPKAKVNKTTNIDLSTYTVQELNALNDKAQKEINKNHKVSQNEANVVLSLSKTDLELYFLKKNYELKSYAWYDSEYVYAKDWDYYWLDTHVDYKTSKDSSQKTDKIHSEVVKINDNFELIYLKMGSTVIKDRRNELLTSEVDGIPRYSWADSTEVKAESEPDNRQAASSEAAVESTPQVIYVTQEPGPEVTPEIVYITAEPMAEVTPEVVYVTAEPMPEVTPAVVFVTPAPAEGIFNTDLADLTDAQLAEAAEAIRAEQRARIKTKVVLDKTNLKLAVGKTDKIAEKVEDLPNGEKVAKTEWSSSDKTKVSVNNGQIKAVAGGEAVITCMVTLSDGTSLSAECMVTVIVPVASVTTDKKSVSLSVGESSKPQFTFKPNNASETGLDYKSSDPDVAAVDENGTITGKAAGKATITATTVDGSGKSVAITVTVKNDGYLKTMNAADFFGRIISGEYASNKVEGGDNEWYDRGVYIGGISFEVHSNGKNGHLLCIEVLDLGNSGDKDIFFKVLDNLFSGDDLKKATNWVKQNLRKEVQLKVGDAYIVLQKTVQGAPIMYIVDEEHKDWV